MAHEASASLRIPCCGAPAELGSEAELLGAALALGAKCVAGWSAAEAALVRRTQPPRPPDDHLDAIRRAIVAGRDPLGEAFTSLRSPVLRRPHGATYTPEQIVEPMLDWAARAGAPSRVVDPGTGSGRFAVAAGRRFPDAWIVGIEIDPLAATLARAHLAAAGLARRSQILLIDYRDYRPPRLDGQTLYVGNPPYVRHHQIAREWKAWLSSSAHARGHRASQLAGLHVHFFLATVLHASPADYGAFVTSAEWLDVNYGALVRDLVLDGLGGHSIHILDPAAVPFDDAATTAAITCFHIGEAPRTVRLRRVDRVEQLGQLDGGRPISRARLVRSPRWTPLTRRSVPIPAGYVQLGELCRVHRGAVTGANRVWILPAGTSALPESVLFPSVTRARELFAAADALTDATGLRVVAGLPADLNALDPADRASVEAFLLDAERRGAAGGYIATHRNPWWSVALRAPAPILATYMARRPPVFVRNIVEARHVNIAHGIYPREPMSNAALDALAAHLRSTVTLGEGRTYAGGLTKFEPKEMERLPVPALAVLESAATG